MKAKVLALDGNTEKEIALPKVFSTPYHPDLIKRAVLSMQANAKQPKGTYRPAGRETSALYQGSRYMPQGERTINVGHARLPRTKNRRSLMQGRVARVSQAVGGPRAHPPKVEKKTGEKINKKERRAALDSAIATTANRELVAKRHVLNERLSLPVVFEDRFSEIAKTKDVVAVLKKFGINADIESAKGKARMRAGKGKRRGRKSKKKKSILIVTGTPSKVYKAARNLEGVDIVALESLNAALLAPGCMPGRLTIWTENAIHALGKR